MVRTRECNACILTCYFVSQYGGDVCVRPASLLNLYDGSRFLVHPRATAVLILSESSRTLDHSRLDHDERRLANDAKAYRCRSDLAHCVNCTILVHNNPPLALVTIIVLNKINFMTVETLSRSGVHTIRGCVPLGSPSSTPGIEPSQRICDTMRCLNINRTKYDVNYYKVN